MTTLEEAIKHAERVAAEQSAKAKTIESNPWGEKSKVKSKIQDCLNCAEEHRQLAAWLRELQEHRKAPEIIRCKECRQYEWMSNRIPEEQTWHCHCWDADTGKDDFCSYAERRTDGT